MSLLEQSADSRVDHFAAGQSEARAWAAGRREWRVKSRLKDHEQWLTAANGDHREHVQQKALGYIAGLREHLGD